MGLIFIMKLLKMNLFFCTVALSAVGGWDMPCSSFELKNLPKIRAEISKSYNFHMCFRRIIDYSGINDLSEQFRTQHSHILLNSHILSMNGVCHIQSSADQM